MLSAQQHQSLKQPSMQQGKNLFRERAEEVDRQNIQVQSHQKRKDGRFKKFEMELHLPGENSVILNLRGKLMI